MFGNANGLELSEFTSSANRYSISKLVLPSDEIEGTAPSGICLKSDAQNISRCRNVPRRRFYIQMVCRQSESIPRVAEIGLNDSSQVNASFPHVVSNLFWTAGSFG